MPGGRLPSRYSPCSSVISACVPCSDGEVATTVAPATAWPLAWSVMRPPAAPVVLVWASAVDAHVESTAARMIREPAGLRVMATSSGGVGCSGVDHARRRVGASGTRIRQPARPGAEQELELVVGGG